MTRLTACLLGSALTAPALRSAQSGVTADTVPLRQSKHHQASKFADLTIMVRDNKFLR